MAKNLEISMLLDFYGDMLTPKQREVTDLYYNEDLSLAEIAALSDITRQGVRDSIKRAEFQLIDCEDKLGLYEKFRRIQDGLDEIQAHAKELLDFHYNLRQSAEAIARTKRIMEIVNDLGKIERS